MEQIPFHQTSSNIRYPAEYHYLLNFWHISKLNKEFEFIKRNGIHPEVKNITRGTEGYNGLNVEKGNSIQTYFYTAFRIFLKSFFKNSDSFKSKDKEEWKISFTKDNNKLSNPVFLILRFNSRFLSDSNDTLLKPAIRTYRIVNNEVFYVRLSGYQSLHGKKILAKISELEERTILNIDDSILTSTLEIGKKLDNIFGISETKEINKNIKRVFDKRFKNSVNVEMEKMGVDFILEPQEDNLEVLLPYYQQLKTFTNALQDRAKFSYILSFARLSVPYDPIITSIEDNENNYLRFLRLTNEFRL